MSDPTPTQSVSTDNIPHALEGFSASVESRLLSLEQTVVQHAHQLEVQATSSVTSRWHTFDSFLWATFNHLRNAGIGGLSLTLAYIAAKYAHVVGLL